MNTLIQDRFIKLKDILEAKKDLFEKILDVTEKLSRSIDEADVDKVISGLSEKQDLIDQVDCLDREFKDYFGDVNPGQVIETLREPELINPGSGKISFREILYLQEIVKKITELLKRIDGLEKTNNTNALSLLNKFLEDIKTINKAKQANLAYNLPVQPVSSSYFFDEKG